MARNSKQKRDAGPAANGTIELGEVAELLGVHYMTVYRYVRTGLLDARQVGGRWQVPEKELARFRLERERSGAGSPGKRTERPTASAQHERAVALADRMIAGDEQGAWRRLDDTLAAGSDLASLYVDVLGEAMCIVGERWASGEASIAEEHIASGVASRLIGRLGARQPRRGRTRGSVIVGAVPGDRHTLPSAIAADLLRGNNFRVVDLGGDVPADQFAEVAQSTDRLVAVGLCATTPISAASRRTIREAITSIHEVTDKPVLLGGAAVTAASTARLLGADGWTSGADDLIEQVVASRSASQGARGATSP